MRKKGTVVLSEYRIFETNEFTQSLFRLQASDESFIRKKLAAQVYPQLRQTPCYGSNIKKLRGYSPETWRYRIGSFRLFFHINNREKIVFILTLEKRKDAYR